MVSKIAQIYSKMSNWGKILLFSLLFIVVVSVLNRLMPNRKSNNGVEGFTQEAEFTSNTEVPKIYDDFYANVYDHLVYNEVKNDYEIGEIVNKTHITEDSRVLDIGSGTGRHVGVFVAQHISAEGIDISPNMVAKAKENYPTATFKVGDIMDKSLYGPGEFTHITCLYFTIYYLQDKAAFFRNCIYFLKPGGYLIVHLANRDKFDPILPPGNPLVAISPQRYAKQRITNTKIKFNDFEYESDFKVDKETNSATFVEKFKSDMNGHVRKNEHSFYMESQEAILKQAQNVGFILDSKIDLLKVAYEYQYLYVLIKPS
jgi:SAM-dependent methyltransferase